MDEEDELADRITQALGGLGTTRYDVAEKLGELGFKGDKAKGASCPIANYLRSEFNLKKVAVSSEIAEVQVEGQFIVEVSLPEQIGAFVDGFDNNQFPDLEAI